MIAATNQWVVALGNLSGLSGPLSDSLCRLATGGGFATRELYTNRDEILLDATRPIIMNGIEDLAARPDLLDRTISIILNEIDDEAREDEATMWDRLELARPRLFGCLLDAVSEALKNLPNTKLLKKPRMADFALWCTAGEAALGLRPGEFLEAYAGNRDRAHAQAVEASTVAMAIVELVADHGAWGGTSKDLLELLQNKAAESGSGARFECKSPRGLSGALRRVAPALKAAGVVVTFSEQRSNRGRLIRLEPRGADCAAPSQPSPGSHVQSAHEDSPLAGEQAGDGGAADMPAET